MKKTTMKALTAAAAALLIAAVFVGGAAATTNISVDKTGIENLWDNATGPTDYTSYWTYEGQDIVIPFNVTGSGDADSYLGGYTLSFDGNLSDATGVKFASANVWGGTSSFVDNGKTIIQAVTGTDLLKIAQANGNRTFNISVTSLPAPAGASTLPTGFYDKVYAVTLTNLTDNLSTAANLYASIDSYKDVGKSTPTLQDYSFWNTDNSVKYFTFLVRNSSEEWRMNNTMFTYADYNTTVTDFVTPGTVYVYYEHEKNVAVVKDVNVTATLEAQFDSKYDTQLWESGKTTLFTVPSQGTKSDYDLKNVLTFKLDSITLDGFASDNTTLTLTLNKGKVGAENITTSTVNLSNWNPAYSVNNQSSASATYDNATMWSFVTPLKANYTIRAGPVDTTVSGGWNTSVKFANITVPGHSDIQWNANITITDKGGKKYDLNNVVSDGNTQLLSDAFFVISNNTVADGTKLLNVEMKGYTLGDANLDYAVNIVDSAVVGITVLKDAGSVNLTFLPAENRIYADCGEKNGDGDIDVNDILAINKFIVGLNPWATA